MRDHHHALAAQHARQDFLHVIRQHARGRVPQAFAARRRDVVGAAPYQHLLVAPFLARIVLVEADEIAIVALVQRLILEDRDFVLAHLGEHQIERALRALERGGEGDIEFDSARLQLPAGLLRLGNPCAVRSTSLQPVNRFFRFQSLWP